jgi:hypothetical protein
MIRKLHWANTGCIHARSIPRPGRRNLDAFDARAQAEQHERELHYFKRQG